MRATCAMPTTRCHIGANEAAASYLNVAAIVSAAARRGCRCRAPGLRISRRERQLRPRVRRRRADVHRAVRRKPSRSWAARPRRGPRRSRRECRSSPAPRDRSMVRRAPNEIAAAASAVGYPLMVKAVAGGGGKGMRVVESRRCPCFGRADGPFRGGVGVRRHRGLFRAPADAAAAHRNPAARRSSWHRRAVRRARMLDSAAPSEGGRRIAVARRDPAAARAHGRGRRRGGQRRRTTPTRAPSSSCSTRTARSISSR